jgi:hypothetical protein
MNSDFYAEFLITIEYDDFITRMDLDEILRAIDRIIEYELIVRLYEPVVIWRGYYPGLPYLKFTTSEGAHSELTYVGIKSVRPGSMKLLVVIGSAVLSYFAKRFAKGVDESLLAKEIARLGHLFGHLVGLLVKRINDWAEKYVLEQRERGGRVRKIEAQLEQKDVESAEKTDD